MRSRGDGCEVYAPMGSTQNVGLSVNGGLVPDEYDSSPILN